MKDEVVEEVRRVREANGERFNFDLDAIFQDLRERELAGGRKVVSLPARRIVPAVEPSSLVAETALAADRDPVVSEES